MEKCIFSKNASQISNLPVGEGVRTCSEVLCGQQSAEKLLGTNNFLTSDEAVFVDKCYNWSKASKKLGRRVAETQAPTNATQGLFHNGSKCVE